MLTECVIIREMTSMKVVSEVERNSEALEEEFSPEEYNLMERIAAYEKKRKLRTIAGVVSLSLSVMLVQVVVLAFSGLITLPPLYVAVLVFFSTFLFGSGLYFLFHIPSFAEVG